MNNTLNRFIFFANFDKKVLTEDSTSYTRKQLNLIAGNLKMAKIDDMVLTMVHFCNLNDLPEPDETLIKALYTFVEMSHIEQRYEGFAQQVKGGKVPPCFIPARELRAILGIEPGTGVPQGALGVRYLDAVSMLEAHGWQRRMKRIGDKFIRGYNKLGHTGIFLYITRDSTVEMCTTAEYAKLD